MSSRDVPHPLAFIICSYKSICTFKKNRLIKTQLQYLSCNLCKCKMIFISRGMAVGKDIRHFLLWHTTSYHIIKTQFIQLKLLPKIMLHIKDKLLLLLLCHIRWKLSSFSNLDRLLATKFFIPFLTKITTSNSCNKRTHLINYSSNSFFSNRYLIVE